MEDFEWQRQDVQKDHLKKLWLIINEKSMTKCSSYTGVEKFIDLSEHCWSTWSTKKIIDFSSPATGVEELKWTMKKVSSIRISDLIKEDDDE